jgi:hypothetical protein
MQAGRALLPIMPGAAHAAAENTARGLRSFDQRARHAFGPLFKLRHPNVQAVSAAAAPVALHERMRA